MMKPIFLVTAFLLLLTDLSAQDDKRMHFMVRGVIVNGDTIPAATLQTCEVIGVLTKENKEHQLYMAHLQYNVLKVYPYARFAASKFAEINKKSLTMSSGERKKFIKEEEKKAKEQFRDQLMGLTYNQGKILIKLVNRETGYTSYDLVKDLRGSFNAFIWQTTARLFTANLKATYDSSGDDKAIELIVRRIERGELR